MTSNSATKYSESKTRLLDLFKESESTRIKKLIIRIDLGNLKSSQLLQKLKSWNRFIISSTEYTPRQKSIRALEIFRVQKLILNATS